MKKKEITIEKAIDRLYDQHCLLNDNPYYSPRLMPRDAFTAHVIGLISQGYKVF